MKNILVPVGNTETAVNTVQYAVDCAHVMGATVYVMRAFTLLPRAGAISNVEQVVQRTSRETLEALVSKVDAKGVDIKIVTYKGDVLDGIKGFEQEHAIDLVIINPKSIDVSDEVFLGSTSGGIMKQTKSAVLIVPENQAFSVPKNILAAFKSGKIEDKNSTLAVLRKFQEEFKLSVRLLLVKTPGYAEEDLAISSALMDMSCEVTITDNATTYQAVLEHFQVAQPDMLCVFRRKKGFFKKLWESNTVLKKDFYTTIPLLVLKGKS